MKRLKKTSIMALLIVTLLIVPISGTVFADENTIDEMVVSPNVLNLESNGGSISVHTEIGFVSTADVILEVNGEQIPDDDVWAFADSCGNLVVKADIIVVKGMVTAGENAVFDLTYILNGQTYIGTDEIEVIQVIPQKA